MLGDHATFVVWPWSAELSVISCCISVAVALGQVSLIWIGWSRVENPDSPGSLLGILTDGDLRRALQDHGAETWSQLTAKDLMTADPITVNADVLVVKALAQMEHNRRKPISVLPVVNQEQQLMGLLRLHDLVQAGLA